MLQPAIKQCIPNTSIADFHCAGTLSVKTSVLKDGHQFVVHIVDPKVKGEEDEQQDDNTLQQNITDDDGAEKADTEKSEKQSKKMIM